METGKQKHQKETLLYYEDNAQSFSDTTRNVPFEAVRHRFSIYIPANGKILDFGCGSGRDTKAFLEDGYYVDAWDGSKALCELASRYTGIQVENRDFLELDAVERYDGIWACSSILHLDLDSLKTVLHKIHTALKPGGVLYTSFKYGSYSGMRNGRYFTDLTEDCLQTLLKDVPGFQIVESWISGDVRPGRKEELWLNLILKKN